MPFPQPIGMVLNGSKTMIILRLARIVTFYDGDAEMLAVEIMRNAASAPPMANGETRSLLMPRARSQAVAASPLRLRSGAGSFAVGRQ
jgi:hypothetical protein